jgi:hypothetical protein
MDGISDSSRNLRIRECFFQYYNGHTVSEGLKARKKALSTQTTGTIRDNRKNEDRLNQTKAVRTADFLVSCSGFLTSAGTMNKVGAIFQGKINSMYIYGDAVKGE